MFPFYLQPSVTQNNEVKRDISHNYNKQTAKRDGGNSFIIIIIVIKSNKTCKDNSINNSCCLTMYLHVFLDPIEN